MTERMTEDEARRLAQAERELYIGTLIKYASRGLLDLHRQLGLPQSYRLVFDGEMNRVTAALGTPQAELDAMAARIHSLFGIDLPVVAEAAE